MSPSKPLAVAPGTPVYRHCARCKRPTYRRGTPGAPDRHIYRARGLDTSCYKHVVAYGNINDWPILTTPRDELLDDYVELRKRGYTWQQCAKALGMKYHSFRRAIERARARGDSRAMDGRMQTI